MPTPFSERWRWAVPFQITRSGIYFLFLIAFTLVATVNSGVNILYFVLGMMLGTLVISLFVSSWTLRHLRIMREVSAPLIAGEPSEIIYTFHNEKRRWPTIAMRFREVSTQLAETPHGFVMHLPSLRAARGTELPPVKITSRLKADRRGTVHLSEIELSTAFPFGFVRRFKRVIVAQELVVYPRIGQLSRHLAIECREAVESGSMTSNRRGGNDEFYGVREYRPGDNVRVIHWRSTARMGQLMIREMAANAPPQLIIVLNLRTRRTGDDAAVERAIEVAAGLVCYGYFENFAVGLAIAGTPGEGPSPRLGRDSRARMLEDLARLDPSTIETSSGIHFPNRIAGRAQWVIVTLHNNDEIADLTPSGPRLGAGTAGRTVLSLDSADSATWLHFLSPADTMRLLRERGSS